jgi:hypothetical protein
MKLKLALLGVILISLVACDDKPRAPPPTPKFSVGDLVYTKIGHRQGQVLERIYQNSSANSDGSDCREHGYVYRVRADNHGPIRIRDTSISTFCELELELEK